MTDHLGHDRYGNFIFHVDVGPHLIDVTRAGSQLIYIPKQEIRKRALLWKVNSVLISYSIHLSSPLIARHNLQKQIPHYSFFFMVGTGKMKDIYRTLHLVLWKKEILLKLKGGWFDYTLIELIK